MLGELRAQRIAVHARACPPPASGCRSRRSSIEASSARSTCADHHVVDAVRRLAVEPAEVFVRAIARRCGRSRCCRSSRDVFLHAARASLTPRAFVRLPLARAPCASAGRVAAGVRRCVAQPLASGRESREESLDRRRSAPRRYSTALTRVPEFARRPATAPYTSQVLARGAHADRPRRRTRSDRRGARRSAPRASATVGGGSVVPVAR